MLRLYVSSWAQAQRVDQVHRIVHHIRVPIQGLRIRQIHRRQPRRVGTDPAALRPEVLSQDRVCGAKGRRNASYAQMR
ncbi:MAG TPA: hypothetical protein VFI95_09110 [Terriglobales bacterium]|nr:hypothetical protein [Terriglobales bacterium]